MTNKEMADKISENIEKGRPAATGIEMRQMNVTKGSEKTQEGAMSLEEDVKILKTQNGYIVDWRGYPLSEPMETRDEAEVWYHCNPLTQAGRITAYCIMMNNGFEK